MTTITSTELGGTGRYIRIAATAAINDKIKTAVAYCRPTGSGGGGFGYLAGKTPSASTAGLRMFVNHNAGSPLLAVGSSSSLGTGAPDVPGTSNSCPYNSWHHLVITDSRAGVTAADLNVIVDGTNVSGTGNNGAGTRSSESTYDLYLMNRGDSAALGREFVGDVAYVAFYDAVLNSTQISNVITNGPMAENTNLIFVFANNTVYHGSADPTNSVAISSRSTRVTGSLPPNTSLGDGASTTPVTSDLAGTYTLTGSVQSDLFASYTLGDSVVSDIAASYSIYSSAANDFAGAYAILGPATFTSEPLKDNTGVLQASKALNYVSLYNPTTGALVVRKTGLSTNASGVFSFSDAGLTAGTTYAVDWETVDGKRRMPRKAAA